MHALVSVHSFIFADHALHTYEHACMLASMCTCMTVGSLGACIHSPPNHGHLGASKHVRSQSHSRVYPDTCSCELPDFKGYHTSECQRKYAFEVIQSRHAKLHDHPDLRFAASPCKLPLWPLLPTLPFSFTCRLTLLLSSGRFACRLLDDESPLFDDATILVML